MAYEGEGVGEGDLGTTRERIGVVLGEPDAPKRSPADVLLPLIRPFLHRGDGMPGPSLPHPGSAGWADP